VLDIHGFVDADCAEDMDHRRTASGYVLNLFWKRNQLDEQKIGCSDTLNYRS
jgi:hypothetical protein